MEEKHERRVFIVDVCKLALLSRRIFLPTAIPRHFPPRSAAFDTREYPTRRGYNATRLWDFALDVFILRHFTR